MTKSDNIDWGFDLDLLPTVRPDAVEADAEWHRVSRLSFYEDGMTVEEFRAALGFNGWTPERFKQTPSYLAAVSRADPEWILDL